MEAHTITQSKANNVLSAFILGSILFVPVPVRPRSGALPSFRSLATRRTAQVESKFRHQEASQAARVLWTLPPHKEEQYYYIGSFHSSGNNKRS